MTNRDIALEYLRCFCAGDIDGLEPLLATDLKLEGTLGSYESASEYLNSLRSDPPDRSEYSVSSVTEGEDSVAIFYEYQKPAGKLTIGQLFKIREGRIREVLLVFDGRGFS